MIAHLSDLHLGRSPAMEARAEALCDALRWLHAERIVVSGDVTDGGRAEEWETFERIFRPLRDRIRVVPGNHDRLGADVGARWMGGRRVMAEAWGELYLVRVDSTGPHNRTFLRSDGDMSPAVLAQIDLALRNAPRCATVAVTLHHHVVRLPEENVWERLATWLGMPNARELPLSAELLETLRGRCDLVLHGHRHVPRASTLWNETPRPLQILNAGSSTELGACRLIEGTEVRWLSLSEKLPDLQPALAV